MASSSLAHLNTTSLKKLREKAEGLQKRVKRLSDKTETVLEKTVHTLEVTATSFGIGMYAGRNGSVPEIAGIPLDLAVGIGASMGAFMGFGGKMSNHLHGIGDGALAHYAAVQGRAVGASWVQKAK